MPGPPDTLQPQIRSTWPPPARSSESVFRGPDHSIQHSACCPSLPSEASTPEDTAPLVGHRLSGHGGKKQLGRI